MKLSSQQKKILDLAILRSAFTQPLDLTNLVGLYSPGFISRLSDLIERNPELEKYFSRDLPKNDFALHKIRYLKSVVSLVESFFVRSIYISGSVAAGNARSGDDIDLFITVRNHTSWIYRFLMMFSVRHLVRREGVSDVQDKLCMNFILEERAFKHLQRDDIFVQHELLHLILVSGPDSRVIDSDGAIFLRPSERRFLSMLFWPINIALFFIQLTYMVISRHHPDFHRLFTNLIQGSIRFYPVGFKDEKLREFHSRADAIYNDLGINR